MVIVGAGPAGLAAAYEAVNQGIRPLVLEQASQVGGIARTETYKGYRFDIGGHRYFTKVPEVQQIWQEIMGPDLLQVPRLSRIFYRGRFLRYPLHLPDALINLGLLESTRIVSSYIGSRLRPLPEEKNLEQWVTNRFGRRLYQIFFQTYTEKVWGIPCQQIGAEWAAQRIRGLSLVTAISNAIFRNHDTRSLISSFHYPVLGPGMMWQRFKEVVEERGAQVRLASEAIRLERDGHRVTGVVVQHKGGTTRLPVGFLISSMPLPELVTRLAPAAPDRVLEAARQLRYRDFVLVGLIVAAADLFPDNWIYVHSPEVRVGRIQNFKNWSAAMVPDPEKSSLGMEYFCTQGDETWQMADQDLIALATSELDRLGLADAADVEDGVVIRQARTYPVYDTTYQAHVATIRDFLATLENLATVGRNGMHRYNNMDHSMLTGMLAVKNHLGARHDLWAVNTERSYHEEQVDPGDD